MDDRRKYSITWVLIWVLQPNRFPPLFKSSSFKGFVLQSTGSASIVSTNGNQVLQVQAWDQDFLDVRAPPSAAAPPPGAAPHRPLADHARPIAGLQP